MTKHIPEDVFNSIIEGADDTSLPVANSDCAEARLTSPSGPIKYIIGHSHECNNKIDSHVDDSLLRKIELVRAKSMIRFAMEIPELDILAATSTDEGTQIPNPYYGLSTGQGLMMTEFPHEDVHDLIVDTGNQPVHSDDLPVEQSEPWDEEGYEYPIDYPSEEG